MNYWGLKRKHIILAVTIICFILVLKYGVRVMYNRLTGEVFSASSLNIFN